jgi:hypothetical protein
MLSLLPAGLVFPRPSFPNLISIDELATFFPGDFPVACSLLKVKILLG